MWYIRSLLNENYIVKIEHAYLVSIRCTQKLTLEVLSWKYYICTVWIDLDKTKYITEYKEYQIREIYQIEILDNAQDSKYFYL